MEVRRSTGTFHDADLGSWGYSIGWMIFDGEPRATAITLESLDTPAREVTEAILQAVRQRSRSELDAATKNVERLQQP
jgi:hypothetical protein